MRFKKKKEGMFVIGMVSLLVAILLGRFSGQFAIIDFFEGLFTGISLGMNLYFLARFGIERRMSDKK